MGAPKQKWTAEEEAALKAGVRKHGAGKWRTILKDPEFNRILYFRSNVDLKDKWRNMSVMPNGYGSKDKPRLSFKRPSGVSKHDGYNSGHSHSAESDEDNPEIRHAVVPSSMLQIRSAPKRPAARMDLGSLIMEAIVCLKENNGSNKTNIAVYIEDQYGELPDFKRLLSEKLKSLTASRRLIKVKRKYWIPPSLPFSDRRTNPSVFPYEQRQRSSPRVEKDDIDISVKSEIDLELAKMRTMTSKEADAAAARAVAEAEAAIAEAEEAEREAEAAEADAAAAQAFADAAMKTMKTRNISKMAFRA